MRSGGRLGSGTDLDVGPVVVAWAEAVRGAGAGGGSGVQLAACDI